MLSHSVYSFQSNEATIQSTLTYTDSIKLLMVEADSLYQVKEYKDAIEVYHSIIENCELSDHMDCKTAMVNSHTQLAIIHSDMELFDDALEDINNAIHHAQKLVDNEELKIKTDLTKGTILATAYEFHVNVDNELLDDAYSDYPSQARNSFHNSLKRINSQNSQTFIRNKTLALNHIGYTYIQEENYEEAKKWYEQSSKYCQQFGKVEEERNIKLNLLFIENQLGNFYDSKQIALSLLNHKPTPTDEIYEAIYYNLAISDYGLKDYESAYDNLKKAFEYSKLSNFKSKRTEVKEIEEKYQNEKLENQALQLQIKNEKSEVDAAKARAMSTLLGSALLFFIGLGFILFYRKVLKEQNLKLQLNQKEQDIEIKAINAMIDGREQEREEIGRFLHDQVAGNLNSANLHLEVLSTDIDDNPLLYKTQGILDDVADQIRTLSHNLLSDVLVKFGLSIALDDLCNRLSNKKIQFQFAEDNTHNKRYNSNIENKLYGISQELASNILKHSQASKAIVSLSETETHLILKVCDNGVGFNKADIESGGVGLYQVKTRTKSIGGNLTIYRDEDDFTTVHIAIPLAVARSTVNN